MLKIFLAYSIHQWLVMILLFVTVQISFKNSFGHLFEVVKCGKDDLVASSD